MKKMPAADASFAVFDAMPDPALVIGGEYAIQYLNAAARRLFHREKASGLFCPRLSPDPGQQLCPISNQPCPLKIVFSEKRSARGSHCAAGGPGSQEQEMTASPIFGEKGEIEAAAVILREAADASLVARLRASEQRYRNMLASSPNAVVTINSQGTIIDCNHSVATLFGMPEAELIGRPATVLMPERFRQRHEEGLRKAVREGSHRHVGRSVELTGWREKGREEFPISLSLSAWQEGEEPFFTAIIMDISRQKAFENSLAGEKQELEKAQRELSAQHAELQRLFGQVEKAKAEWEQTMDCIGDLVMLIDAEDRILRCNKAVTEFSGEEYPRIISRNWEELLLDHGMETHYSRGKAIELFHRPSGSWFLLNIYDYGKEAEFDTRYVVTLHETTKLKQIAEELTRKNVEIEENRRKLKTALDGISSLIEQVTNAKESGVRFKHPGFGRCWERMSCGQKECPCFGKEDLRCWQETGTYCKATNAADDGRRKNCDVCPFYQEATLDPIYQIGEQFNNMMHILESKNQELENAYKELKATQAQILQQEKMASIGQLAAGVAHELNNPLGFIASNLSSLQKYLARIQEFMEAQSAALAAGDRRAAAELDCLRQKLKLDFILEDTVSLIRESLEGADRLKKIILDLKTFSRVDQAQFTHADIIDGLESTINIVWNELKYKATVKRDYGELPRTKCYPQQLNQVFMNLLVNAGQAIDKQGEILIRTWCDGTHIFVAVSDTGCGIPEENLKRVFEPFFTTKEVGKGTGLGLSIAYDIIKKHKGELLVASELGKGTTFTVKIPVVEGK